VPVRDAASLEAALRRLIEAPALRLEMGRRARERVDALYSFDAVIAQLIAIYRDCLDETQRDTDPGRSGADAGASNRESARSG